jgi:aromatic-L-amino-acid decarboxylase
LAEPAPERASQGVTDSGDPLALDPEAMRRMGYRTVDMLVERIAATAAEPALRRASPHEMRERLPGLPEHAGDIEALLEQLERDVLPYASRCDHPGYFAFIPTAGTFPSALGDFIASALNIYAGSWMESAGPSRVELILLDLFKEWIGYPSGASGLLVSGGSAANMTALVCARQALAARAGENAVAYVSDQAHSSLARAARGSGLRSDQVHVLPSDSRYRLRPDALAGAIAADRRAGRVPMFVAASAGSTNTGAIDPLPEIADICRDNEVWLHVDGAYGGFAALTERGSRALAGIERADSVTLDPHKWLYQPFECGCLLVREGDLLRQAFEIAPDYLKDAATRAGEVNFADLGLQLSRSARALKLWLSLGYFGVDAFRATIDRALDFAVAAEQLIAGTPELELMSPAQLGIVCFRRRFERRFGGEEEWRSARLNAALVGQFEASGLGLVSSTQLDGRYAVRLCIMSHTSAWTDVERTIEWFAQAPEPDLSDPSAEFAVALGDRAPAVAEQWLPSGDFTTADIAALSIFEDAGAAVTQHAADWGHEQRVPAGGTVVERWEGAREFFVIVEGEAEVHIGGELMRSLRAGDFFGELAALDWGGGYGYVRTATVVATRDLRLLVLEPERLAHLMAESATLNAAVRAAARERLRRS